MCVKMELATNSKTINKLKQPVNYPTTIIAAFSSYKKKYLIYFEARKQFVRPKGSLIDDTPFQNPYHTIHTQHNLAK